MKKKYNKVVKKAAAYCLSAAMVVGSAFGYSLQAEASESTTFVRLDQDDMNIVDFYSEYSSTPASNMLDGNTSTMWENDWSAGRVEFPTDAFTVDLGEVKQDVSQFIYTPRQGGNTGGDLNGRVTQYEIYAGTTKENMEKVAEGTWESDAAEKTATFEAREARYIKLRVLAASMNPDDPSQTLTSAEVNVAVSMILEANDTEFLAIPQGSLSAVYYPSQYSGNPIANIFDGNSSTFWETNWGSGSTPFAAGDYFIIDLGASREHVSRISYTPRQDSSNGRIKEYEIYTSNAETLDGHDLEANGFTLAGKGTWAADALDKTATFNSKTARYIAVKANSVGGDGSTITCGEFNVLLKKGVVVDPQTALDKIEEVEAIIESSDNEIIKEKLQEVVDRISADVINYTQEGMDSVIAELEEAVETYASIGKVDSIRPGKVWVDNEGVPIQAHGSNIMYDETTKTYYWYGEHKGADNVSTGAETGTPAIGISCYSSKDLYNWTNEGVALPVFNNPQIMDGTGTDDTPMYLSEKTEAYQNSTLPEFAGSALSGTAMKSPVNSLSQFNTDEYIAALNAQYTGLTLEEKQEIYAEFNWNRVVERPKVVYNKNTGKYVMWWHQDGPTVGQYTVASAGVAISDSPTGPFKYLDTFRLPNTGNEYGSGGEGMLRDMTLFADDDGTGYVIFSSEDNATTIIQKLNEDYTEPSGSVEGTDYVRVFPGQYREAPAVFKDGDTYYMITSGQSGWNPNPCKYAYSTNGIMGTWSTPEFFCQDDITLNNEPAATPSAGTTYRSQSTNILQVRDSEGNIVPGQFIYMGDRWFRENLKDSRYIWLPLDLNTETHEITMSWKDSWKIAEEFEIPEEKPCTHANTEVVNAKAATCTVDGYTGDTVCKDCGETVDTGKTIKAAGHTAETVPGKAATCTATGLTDGSVCSACGEVLTAQKTIPMAAHAWSDWTVVKEATTEEAGIKEHTCSACGEKETDVIPKLEEKPEQNPEQPGEPETKPETKPEEKPSSPVTGDPISVAGLAAMLGVSAGTIAQLKRKKEDE